MSCNVNISKLEELVRKALGVPDDVAFLIAAKGEHLVAILAKKNVGTLVLDVTPNGEFDSCEELAHHIASTIRHSGSYFYRQICSAQGVASPLGTEVLQHPSERGD